MNKDDKALLWLDSYDFMSYKKKDKLLNLFESPGELLKPKTFTNNREDILNILTEEEFDILRNQATDYVIDELLNNLDRLDISFITCFSDKYPYFLKNIDTPPYVIYYKGNLSLLKTDCFAIVGSRHITNYGKLVTEKFTKDLVQADFTIISGLAAGVDTVAHSITVANKGKTIAVLAGGLDEIYPPTNSNLAKQIIENDGLLITETRPGKKTESYMFPIRNRIIAALSRGILVTEAREKSGVIHTKNYALEYGKDVFAVPGNILNETSKCPNRMIVNGQAKAVMSSEDILEEYDICLQKKAKAVYNLSLEESIIINVLTNGEKTFQEIVELTKLPVKTLNSLLTTLTIRGIIKKLAGNIYYLAN